MFFKIRVKFDIDLKILYFYIYIYIERERIGILVKLLSIVFFFYLRMIYDLNQDLRFRVFEKFRV